MRTFIAYCSAYFSNATSCQSPQVRTPTKTSSGSFIEASVARNKLNLQAREGYYRGLD